MSSPEGTATTADFLDRCGDSCGWIACAVAAVCYGSYGVPIKETLPVVRTLHPLVFQSYKTLTMFALCWWVALAGVPVRFSAWGLLSGALWVLGGTAGVVAVRSAGMAVAVGTWASVMVCVNFVWGFAVFREPVRHVGSAAAALLLLTAGLIGMSHWSQPHHDEREEQQQQPGAVESVPEPAVIMTSYQSVVEGDQETSSTGLRTRAPASGPARADSDEEPQDADAPAEELVGDGGDDLCHCCGFVVRKRIVGLACAVCNGILTGTSLVPVHYAAQEGLGGVHYLISFSTGALVANTVLWFLLIAGQSLLTLARRRRRLSDAALLAGGSPLQNHTHTTWDAVGKAVVGSLPEWQFQRLWLPGISAGILLAVAMYSSIMAVTYLGQGIGNSVIQAKILISGVWGIFWYREIRHPAAVRMWFASAVVTVTAILWLSEERITGKQGEGGGGHRYLLL